jgi:hypothetical protein
VEAHEHGGVLLRFADETNEAALGFVPASTAVRLAALSTIVPVPGARLPVLGIALADGAVVTVLRLGAGVGPAPGYEPDDAWPVPGAGRAVVCRLDGLDVALTGGTVLATGLFDAAPGRDGVLWRGDLVPVIDVRALYAQAEAAVWADRAARVAGRPHAPRTPAPGPFDDEPGPRPTMLPELPGPMANQGGAR